jgi:hypothetical protein
MIKSYMHENYCMLAPHVEWIKKASVERGSERPVENGSRQIGDSGQKIDDFGAIKSPNRGLSGRFLDPILTGRTGAYFIY